LQSCKLVVYLWRWSSQLNCMHPVITTHKVVVREIEELADPTVDLGLLQVFPEHPGCVLASLVFIPRMHPPLAWLH